jgi:superfamily II DNA or RNA helicase
VIFGPRVHFDLPWHPILAPAGSTAGRLDPPLMEVLVPGTEVYGWIGKWYRPKPGSLMPPSVRYGQVRIALHSAWRAQEELAGAGVADATASAWEATGVELSTDHGWLLDHGWQVAWAAVQRGELAVEALEIAAPHQLRFGAWAATRPWALARHSAGAGKTLSLLLAFLSRPGDGLVVVPGKARKEWASHRLDGRRSAAGPGRFTALESFRVQPEGERRKGDEDLKSYLARMRAARRRALVVVGMESLGSHLEELSAFNFSAFIVDEVHEIGDSHLHEMTANADGTDSVKQATTDGGDTKRAVAAYQLTRRGSITLRAAATATPLDDGAMKRLWGPLNLLSPGGFGRLHPYTQRYCGVQMINGYWNDKGASNVEELRRRWSFFVNDVPRSESHAHMPAMRLEVTYLGAPGTGGRDDWTVQNRPAAMAREIRARTKEAQTGGYEARLRKREALLAEACSRKRNAVRLRSAEFLRDGGRAAVLMTRRDMVEAWAAQWREEFPGVTGWAIHGDTSQDERDAALDIFMESKDPCWIIGTGYTIGTGVNALQYAHLLTIAQLPDKPGHLLQWLGRGDRLDGVGTILWVPVAEGSYDDQQVARINRKMGPIERLLDAPELRDLSDALEGDDDELEDSILDKLIGKGSAGAQATSEEEEDETMDEAGWR